MYMLAFLEEFICANDLSHLFQRVSSASCKASLAHGERCDFNTQKI